MDFSLKTFIAAAAALPLSLALVPAPAAAGVGDLLVAPTRIVLDGRKASEIVLNNIGDEPATYRISVEFRRMKADGTLAEVTQPTPGASGGGHDRLCAAAGHAGPARAAVDPHRRPAAEGLADGEYRVHLLFRAVPTPNPVVTAGGRAAEGRSAQADPDLRGHHPGHRPARQPRGQGRDRQCRSEKYEGKPAIGLDLSRTGTRSTFGEIRVLKAGVKDPIAIEKGIAVYTEVGDRM